MKPLLFAYGLSAVLLTPPQAFGDDRAAVVLQVQSKSWIKESAFDEAHLRGVCENAGVELVAPGTAGARATAIVIYRETKGPGFSMFGLGTPAGYGTDISFNLTLTDARTSKTLTSVRAQGATPAGLPVERFYEGAVEALHASPAYLHACDVVAGALGSRSAMLRLLPWAVVDAGGKATLERLGFVAQSDIERAYMATAQRDYAALKSLGAVVVEPLTLLFENSGAARNDVGLFSATDAGNAQVMLRALPILAAVDDERVSDALTTFVGDYAAFQSKDSTDANAMPVLAATIRLLGRVGSVFTLPLLDEWQKGDGALTGEARTAADALRKRLAIE